MYWHPNYSSIFIIEIIEGPEDEDHLLGKEYKDPKKAVVNGQHGVFIDILDTVKFISCIRYKVLKGCEEHIWTDTGFRITWCVHCKKRGIIDQGHVFEVPER